ncbi:MAG: hypothetical protein EWM73_01621 [Nitrospira sp.]|nr:MAG: hypothetical protein EWM73_01621 [Nitrospira sp.]
MQALTLPVMLIPPAPPVLQSSPATALEEIEHFGYTAPRGGFMPT